MNITKFGHCCVLLDMGGVRILIDPGAYSTGEDTATNIDAILITHEHTDHFHVESLKKVLANNPKAIVITNKSVGSLLQKEMISYTQVGDGESAMVRTVPVEGFGREHARIYADMGPCENTGFLVGETFYYGGDSFYIPSKPVDVLALPVDAPWMKVSEAVEFAKTIRPRVVFPVHDAMQTESTNAFYDQMFTRFFGPEHIAFVPLVHGKAHEF